MWRFKSSPRHQQEFEPAIMTKYTKRNNILFSLSLVAILIAGIIYLINLKPSVIINKKPLTVEVAMTQSQHWQGLSSRDKLAENTGMLFLFNDVDSRIFYNQDLKFPIKVIWINGEKIVGISDLPVDTGENTLVHSPEPIDKVLEISNQTFKNINIKNGEQIKIRNVKKTKE